MYSEEHLEYLKKRKLKQLTVLVTQISIVIFFIILWQILANKEIINTFIFSSPKKIIETIMQLYKNNMLFNNIWITLYETIISFVIGTLLGIFIATILWWNKFIAKVFDPFLTILNSLPKVALGPIIIIWAGANIKSIIIMALLISVIITIINIYQGFSETDPIKIKLMKSFKANKAQIFTKLILPSNFNTIISSLKINISMSLIGVIMGEFLVSKAGLGYLIVYGSQVFNLNLIMTGTIILALLAALMYYIVVYIEKKLIKY